jgi:hypothetical protein
MLASYITWPVSVRAACMGLMFAFPLATAKAFCGKRTAGNAMEVAPRIRAKIELSPQSHVFPGETEFTQGGVYCTKWTPFPS